MAPALTRGLLDLVTPQPAPQDPAVEEGIRGRLARLTDREREVLVAVAHGYSNARISELLNMAEATVKTHAGRLMGRLEPRRRVQAVIFAYDARLVAPRG